MFFLRCIVACSFASFLLVASAFYWCANASEISVSPTSLELGNTGINSPKHIFIDISNSGPDSLVISQIQITGSNSSSYSVTPGGVAPCSSLTPTIPALGSCSLNVTLSADDIGVKTASIEISSNDSLVPNLSIPAEGVVDDPTVSISIDGTGSGTVSYVYTIPGGSASAPVLCSQNCFRQFPSGTQLTLTPALGLNSNFSGWQGCPNAGPQTNDCSTVLSQDTHVAAIFSDTTPVNGGLSLVDKFREANCGLSKIVVDWGNPSNVYADGECGFYKSVDGNNFNKTFGGRFYTLGLDRLTPNNIYAGASYVLWSTSNGMYTSSDSGESSTHVAIGNIQAIAVDPSNGSNVYCSTEATGIFKKQGTSWVKVDSPSIDSATVKSLHVDKDGVLYAGTNYGLKRSYDQGNSWQNVAVPNSVNAHIFNSHPYNANYLLVGQWSSTLAYLSKDKGNTWTQLATTIGKYTAIEFIHSDPSTLYASTSAGVYASYDSGTTWSLVAGVIGVDVALIPDTAPQQFFVVGEVVSHLHGHVYKSEPIGLSAVPGKIYFDTLNTHNVSDSKILTLTNHSNAVPPVPVTISSLSLNGGNAESFSISNGSTNSCLPTPKTLDPDTSCTLTINFDPSTIGNKSSSLVIKSNDVAYPLLGVSISGKATTTPPTGTLSLLGKPVVGIPSATAELTASDATGSSTGMKVRTSINNRTWTVWEDFEDSKFVSLPVGDGPKNVYVQFLSSDGAFSKVYSDTITLESKPPVATITPLDPRLLINTANPSFTLAADEPVKRFECSFNGGEYITCSSTYSLTDLIDGSYFILVRAVDLFDNVGQSVRYDWSIDITAPETVMAATTYPYSETSQFNFTSQDLSATFECNQDNSVTWYDCTSPHPISSFTAGNHVFKVRAKDLAGNVDPSPENHSWSYTVCKARIVGGGCYSSLALAYADAINGDIIQCRAIVLPDSGFSANKAIEVSIKGGFDDQFASSPLGATTLSGINSAMIIQSGSLSISQLTLK